MIPRNLFDIECEAVTELASLNERRAASEVACIAEYEAAKANANRELTRARKTILGEKEQELASIQASWDETRASIEAQYIEKKTAAAKLQKFTVQESYQRAKDETAKMQSAFSDALWTADSLYEAAEKHANDQLANLRRVAAEKAKEISESWQEATPIFERAGLEGMFGPEKATGPITQAELLSPTHLAELEAALVKSDQLLEELETLVGGMAFSVKWLVKKATKQKAEDLAREFAQTLNFADRKRKLLHAYAEADHKRCMREAAARRTESKQRAQAKFPPMLAKIADREKAEAAGAADKNERENEKLRMWNHDSLRKAEGHFRSKLADCESRFAKQLAEAEAVFEKQKIETRNKRDRAWNDLCKDWRDGQDRLGKVFNQLKGEGIENCPDWSSHFWNSPPPTEHLPQGIRFGDISIDLSQLPGGLPTDEDLQPTIPARMRLPAFLPFPNRTALLLKARDEGRAVAVQSMQSMMLRFLTAVPAGKVKFTVIDPVGLGDNFAAFMHLADFDESMIGSRIWTEAQQIEKRLADLTAHMENVIQKYLRSQFKTIEEYNAQAGEVAEAFRVLVIANFPANFTLDAARRLVSIVNSGSTCGVFTLMSIDTKLPVPQGFNASDLEQASLNLVWKDSGYTWKDSTLALFPLTLEMPPDAETAVRLVRLMGERGRDTKRVEVPFEYVAPAASAIWTRDSRRGISVPIGRSGATKRQLFEVGKGTAQHALVAGKTGSGKSTLLHALITNLAMNYSPDEVELYLIDFKKGVEFKAYSTNRLPHAKVIAVESEREFGLSVLQRLDVELKERGEKYRTAGVNDLGGYRDWQDQQVKKNGSGTNGTRERPMPRIMLLVDEFQEFFVEDDRVSQECALLLDRLVRQGRAFGLHLLLGSQTLGGAYSLARSTIDQMAIRIALQCSDADAQLILSKDNTAARLLSRPGEAIYNDANGLIEGNDLFQIVWISDKQKEEIIHDLADRAEKLNGGPVPPALVFEGNVNSDIAQNPQIKNLLALAERPPVRSALAWLGDAVAIKDPTAATFRPQSGSNLIMVGQHDEAAPALFAAVLVGLGIQHDEQVRFVVLDGTPDDDASFGSMGRAANVLRQRIDFIDRTGPALGTMFTALLAEVNARLKNETPDRTPIYLMILGLHRFRDLRKDEDMSFGRRGADRPISPIEAFTTIYREGPSVGVHTIAWCDALTNLNRAIDRQGLREFGMRVLFQMSSNDSSTLIDNPSASRLGRHRALYIAEEMSQPEKFRPYGQPSPEWLRTVRERLRR